VRRLAMAGVGLLALGTALLVGVAPVTAQGDAPAGVVDVVKVNGLIDPVMAGFIQDSVREANESGAVALVLQADSQGVVISDEAFDELLDVVASSQVPVDVWVGPSGSSLTGTASLLAAAGEQLGMAPGTRIGGAPPWEGADLDPERQALLTGRTSNDGEAADLGLTTVVAPTIGDLIVNLPGVETQEVTTEDGQTRREPLTQVRFSQLSLFAQLMHTVASPPVAFLLLAVGLGLLVFELFTAGIGVAGVIGAGSFVLGCYGLVVLPTRWWAATLLCLAFVAFAVDVQTGVPRFWTGVGVVAFVVASLTLYDGLSLSWITLVAAIVGVLLAFLGGMPAMVRTRFSTPTIGREWMIGEMGRAVTAVDPDGVVQLRDALWRATTNRATPVEELDRVRVVGIEGLVLEVEPEEGGARDYRERGRRKGRAGDVADPDGAGEGADGPTGASDEPPAPS
jgi:membrane-bound serine protease (ClpP class)